MVRNHLCCCRESAADRDSQQLCDPFTRPLLKVLCFLSHLFCLLQCLFFFFPCMWFTFFSMFTKKNQICSSGSPVPFYTFPALTPHLCFHPPPLQGVSSLPRVKLILFLPVFPSFWMSFSLWSGRIPSSFTPLSRKGIRKETSYYHFPQHVTRDALVQLRSEQQFIIVAEPFSH